jgi:hypothetical protein
LPTAKRFRYSFTRNLSSPYFLFVSLPGHREERFLGDIKAPLAADHAQDIITQFLYSFSTHKKKKEKKKKKKTNLI